MAKLQPAEGTLSYAVNATLEQLKLGPMDTAAAQLARKYAKAIDDANDLAEAISYNGPKLLSCLESLGATPAARARMIRGARGRMRGGGGDGGNEGKSRLDQLREARR